jgi:hypothetical protein
MPDPIDIARPRRLQRSAASDRKRLTTRIFIAISATVMALLAHANDFPTRARVEFVLDCMRDSKAPPEEAMYKCSCAIDEIAAKVDYATWVDMSTVSNGITIAGERGGVMRDMKDGRKIAASFRELQAEAKKRCFLKD